MTSAELGLLPLPSELLTGLLFFPADAEALTAVDLLRPIDGMRMIEYFDSVALPAAAGRGGWGG